MVDIGGRIDNGCGIIKVMGRHAKYTTENELKKTITAYFVKATKDKQAPNKAGLCVHLHIHRDTYSEYRKKYPDTIKTADAIIENWWVNRLSSNAPTGAIFYLKNAFRESFRDRYDNEVSVRAQKPLDEPDKNHSV